MGGTEEQLNHKPSVDVLAELARARERHQSAGFWRRNLDVMKSTINLLEATSTFMKLVNAAR